MYFCAPHVFFSYQRSALIPNQIPRKRWKWSLCLISTVWWPMRSTTHLIIPVSNIEGLWGMVPLFTQRKGVTDPLRPCGPSLRPPQGPDARPPKKL